MSKNDLRRYSLYLILAILLIANGHLFAQKKPAGKGNIPSVWDSARPNARLEPGSLGIYKKRLGSLVPAKVGTAIRKEIRAYDVYGQTNAIQRLNVQSATSAYYQISVKKTQLEIVLRNFDTAESAKNAIKMFEDEFKKDQQCSLLESGDKIRKGGVVGYRIAVECFPDLNPRRIYWTNGSVLVQISTPNLWPGQRLATPMLTDLKTFENFLSY